MSKRLQWDKACYRAIDPARVLPLNDCLAPDEEAIKVVELTPEERARIARFESTRDKKRAELKRRENSRRRKRRAGRKTVFQEDADREARLQRESDERKRIRAKSQQTLDDPTNPEG